MRSRHLAVLALTGILVAIFATGCAQFNRNWTRTVQTLHEGKYMVTGRVTDMQTVPIDKTRVYLLKQYFHDPRGLDQTKAEDIDSQHLVDITDGTGEFIFNFELLSADDVWLYVDASKQGYKPRFVRLNKHMGDSLFDYPGCSPISVHVVLEKEMDKVAEN